MIIIIYF